MKRCLGLRDRAPLQLLVTQPFPILISFCVIEDKISKMILTSNRFAHEVEDADEIGEHVEKLFLSGVDKDAADAAIGGGGVAQ